MITQSSFKSSAAIDPRKTIVRILVISLILLLAILHQDWWWWDAKEPLVFGFMPVGLAWHAGISLAAGLVGLLAVRFCWPDHLDDEVEEEAVAETGKEEAS